METTRECRHIGVSLGKLNLIVSLFWRERVDGVLSDVKDLTIDHYQPCNYNSVQQALNTFLREGAFVIFQNGSLLAFTKMLDDDPQMFDFILDAENPAQALISHYVIER